MKQIRKGAFETNSSSTHSLTMCSKELYEKWRTSDLYLVRESDSKLSLMTKEEVRKYFKELYKNNPYVSPDKFDNDDFLDDYMLDYEISTYEDWGHECLEEFYDEYTTESGETIVAFGEYGFDG